MPTELVGKPVEETRQDDGSGSDGDSDSDDTMPDLEEQDPGLTAQQSQVEYL